MVVIIITFVWRSDSGLLQGKPVLKKENGTPGYGVSTYSAPSALDNNGSRQLPSYRYIMICLRVWYGYYAKKKKLAICVLLGF